MNSSSFARDMAGHEVRSRRLKARGCAQRIRLIFNGQRRT
jgi:hypothetical protein